MSLKRRLDITDMHNLGPRQLNSLLIPLYNRLHTLKNTICDVLSALDVCVYKRVSDTLIGDMFELFAEYNLYAHCDDITPESLSILSYNYNIINQMIDRYIARDLPLDSLVGSYDLLDEKKFSAQLGGSMVLEHELGDYVPCDPQKLHLILKQQLDNHN